MDSASSSSSASSHLDESESSSIGSYSEASQASEVADELEDDIDNVDDDIDESDEEDWGVQLEVSVKRVGKGEKDCVVIKIDSNASVRELKQKICDELTSRSEPIPPERQRLIFSGRMLNNSDGSLTDENMKPGTLNVVHLSPLPQGAVPSIRSEAEVAHSRRRRPTTSNQSPNRPQQRQPCEQGSTPDQLSPAQERRNRRRVRNRDQPYTVSVPSRMLVGTQQGGVLPSAASVSIPLTQNIEEPHNEVRAAAITAVSTPSVCPALGPGMVLPLTTQLSFPPVVASQPTFSLQNQQNANTNSGSSSGIFNPMNTTINQELALSAAQLSTLLVALQDQLANISDSNRHANLLDLLDQVSRRSTEVARLLRINSISSITNDSRTTLPFMSAALSDPSIASHIASLASNLTQAFLMGQAP